MGEGVEKQKKSVILTLASFSFVAPHHPASFRRRVFSLLSSIMAAVTDAEYARWRAGAPLLYDWLSSQSLLWPSLSCR